VTPFTRLLRAIIIVIELCGQWHYALPARKSARLRHRPPRRCGRREVPQSGAVGSGCYVRVEKGFRMKRARQITSGIFGLAFALLAVYCSIRAIQVYRQLDGRPDIHDSARDWSTGASACFVACGVILVLARKKQAAVSQRDATGGGPPFRWWRTTVGMVLLAAVGLVAVLAVIIILQPPPKVVPSIAPPPPPDLPHAPAPSPPTVP